MASGEGGKLLYLVVSMDCERVRSESYYGDGTDSWQTSERAIVGLADILQAEGLKGTFLPTPATAAKHAQLFQELHRAGFEVGMQFHCDSFRDGEYRQPLGAYSRREQEEILRLAKEDWEQALGMELVAYRSGYLSASDDTFSILAELGIKQTSCSKPGRHVPSRSACWLGATPYAHRASARCRLEPGELDLVEVPVSSHPAERFSLRESFDPMDARPDHAHPFPAYAGLVDAVLWELELLQPPVKSFVVLTHNTIDYTDRQERRTRTLLRLLRYIKAREEDGWQIVPATLALVREALLRAERERDQAPAR